MRWIKDFQLNLVNIDHVYQIFVSSCEEKGYPWGVFAKTVKENLLLRAFRTKEEAELSLVSLSKQYE